MPALNRMTSGLQRDELPDRVSVRVYGEILIYH